MPCKRAGKREYSLRFGTSLENSGFYGTFVLSHGCGLISGRRTLVSTPGSLQQALDALEADHGFLLRGDLGMIDTWLSYKRKNPDTVRDFRELR